MPNPLIGINLCVRTCQDTSKHKRKNQLKKFKQIRNLENEICDLLISRIQKIILRR